MSNARFYIFVEGVDDERMIENIFKPLLLEKHEYIHIYKYSNRTKRKVKSVLQSIEGMGANYLFLGDRDNAPCVSDRKTRLIKKYTSLDPNKTIIVVKEIESWYLAGLVDSRAKDMGIEAVNNSENICKEKFNKMKPKKISSVLEFKLNLLSEYDMETAISRNDSLKYFHKKCCD